MDILMTEDDEALINGVYHEFEEGDTVTVPDWVGRSFKEKGTATDPDGPSEEQSDQEADETFANPDQRETKEAEILDEVEELPDEVEAERTAENSPWWQFRTPDGDLLLKADGDPLKAQGTDQRDAVLQAINET